MTKFRKALANRRLIAQDAKDATAILNGKTSIASSTSHFNSDQHKEWANTYRQRAVKEPQHAVEYHRIAAIHDTLAKRKAGKVIQGWGRGSVRPTFKAK